MIATMMVPRFITNKIGVIGSVLAIVLLLTLGVSAGDALVPFDRPEETFGTLPDGRIRLRGEQTVHIYVPKPGSVDVEVTVEGVGIFQDPTSVQIIQSPNGSIDTGEHASFVPWQTGNFTFEASRPGVWSLNVNTGRNAAIITPDVSHWSIAGDANGALHSIYRSGPLYFYVPHGVDRFEVWAQGGGPQENLLMRVITPDGAPYADRFVIGDNAPPIEVIVSDHQSGKPWAIEVLPPPAGSLENATIWFSSNIPGGVSLSPDRLLVPFVSASRHVQRDGSEGTTATDHIHFVRNSVEPWKTNQLAVSLYRREPSGDGEAGIVASADLTIGDQIGSGAVWDTGQRLSPGSYYLNIKVMQPDGEVAVSWQENLEVMPASSIFSAGYSSIFALSLSQRHNNLPTLTVIPQTTVTRDDLLLDIQLSVVPLSSAPGSPGSLVIHEEQQPYPGRRFTVTPPDAPLRDGLYTWQVEIRHKDSGTIGDVYKSHFVLKDNQLFEDQTRAPERRPLLWVSDEDEQRGWIVYAPPFTDAIPYGYRPDLTDLLRDLSIIAPPGEYVPMTLGLLSLDQAHGLTVEVSDLIGPGDAVIASQAISKERAHYWAQRPGWRSETFWIIPEILVPLREPEVWDVFRRRWGMPEPSSSFDMLPLQQEQIWMTVHIPENAPAGIYEGTVTVRDRAGSEVVKEVALEVLPFPLANPTHRHWGLYTDSSRWNGMSEERVAQELLDYKAHGINSLMMYPLTNGSIHVDEDTDSVKWDLEQFDRYMKMARETGLSGPFVISLQALHGRLSSLAGVRIDDDRFAQLYRKAVRSLVQYGEENEWGELVFHAVDEPSTPEAAQQTLRLLGLLKDEGVRTFTTANNPLTINSIISPVLDIRTWWTGFFRSDADIDVRWKEVEVSGADLWMYGTGSYTGQEGRMYQNRFLAGFFFYKTGTDGIWSWTLQRAKEEPFNDFDGENANPREPKDAMITYPSAYTSTGSYSTLQWEGIREGVTDFRYVYTLAQLLETNDDPELHQAFATLLSDIPSWTSDVPDSLVLEHLRSEVINLLKEYMN